MTVRRVLVRVLLVLLAAVSLPDLVAAQVGVPTSIGLIYSQKKIFKPGDWVFYEVHGSNIAGDSSVDYQRVQIGVTRRLRGEDCFWLETGWGTAPQELVWSAVLISEGIFEDSLAEARGNAYLRMMHMETTENGVPLAAESRTVDPKNAEKSLPSYRPEYVDLGLDTLTTPKGPIACRLVEVTKISRVGRDTPDSTMQQITESKTRRWLNPDLIPITGIVHEEETRTYTTHVWPLGKPSKDFPPHITAIDRYRIDLLDFGHGAKPQISDRIRDSREVRAEANVR